MLITRFSDHFSHPASTVFSNNAANQRLNPHKLTVCQQTGTLIVAVDRFVKLFRFVECVNDGTRFKYIDFIELPLEIELEFVPIYLDINEHIIAAGSKELMCVFKLLERNYCNTADSDAISANSMTTSSELSGIGAVNYAPNAMPDGKAAHNDYATQAKDSEVFDYRKASGKLLSAITSNIASTFDFRARTGSDKRLERSRRSVELKPAFIDNSMPLCSLRHLSSTNDTVCNRHFLLYPPQIFAPNSHRIVSVFALCRRSRIM